MIVHSFCIIIYCYQYNTSIAVNSGEGPELITGRQKEKKIVYLLIELKENICRCLPETRVHINDREQLY